MRTREHDGIALFLKAAIAFLFAAAIAPAYADPVAAFSRTEIDFSTVTSGSPSPLQAVFVTNTGDAPLAISGTSISGADAADFTVAGTCGPPISLPPNARCRLDFTLQGTGNRTTEATFSLQSNSPSPPPTIMLRGFLVVSQGWFVQSSADWIDFPTTPTGGSATSKSIFILSNDDLLSFKIVGIALAGGNVSDFALSSTCVVGTGLPSAPGCSATIDFHPAAPGPRATELQLDLALFGLPRRFTFSVTGVGGPAGPPATVNVVEYHHAAFDHYFITPVAAEQALLDARAPPFQDWSRTGFSFNAYVNAGAPAGSVAICRFFNDHFTPKSSHFYAAHGLGCEATIAQFPDWTLEDDKLFNTMLPDATTGACPAGTIPLYRMYNQGMGGAPNHRFVTSLAERQKMLDHGFVAEGAGIGVGMCVPP